MRGAGGREAADLEVDAVLRRLPVLDVYRVNIFRITGVPTDASPAAVRRRREEAMLAARLGAPLPVEFGDLAPDPPPDAHALKDAFEAMYNPVLRLVHEMFWLWGDDGAHDRAVAAHCTALESPGAPDALWREALASWATALADPGCWTHAERRAKDLDDPRVSTSTVAGLREVLPMRIVGVGAALAVAAASAGDAAGAARHLDLLRSSPFPSDLVEAALRRALRATESRLHDETETASRVGTERPEEAVAAATDLLARSRQMLGVYTALLGAGDPLTAALHDEVASTAARCAIAQYNATERPADALPVLEAAAAMAREATTTAFLQRNLRTLADAGVLGVIGPWREAGDVDGAADLLRVWRGRTGDPAVRENLDRLLADPRAIRASVDDGAGRRQYVGCGVRPFGRRAYGADETWLETRCATVFWVPVLPLGAYLSDENFVYAKVPMSPWTRWAQVLVLGLAAVVVAAVAFSPPVALALAVVLAAALGIMHLSRRRQMAAYLAEHVPEAGG
jgi:hypothetical protein